MVNFFDIHSHIQFPEFDKDRDEVIDRMKKTGVFSVVVGTDFGTSRSAVMLAEKHENLFASVGLHPNDAVTENFDEKSFRELIANPKVVAVGECGLDYFRTAPTGENKQKQKNVFEKQIKLALEFGKPLMIHCRNAYGDLIDILAGYKKEYGEKLRGNIHFFAGDRETVEKFLELGFTMSFTGVITFANQYDEVVKRIPLTSIMAETDCPYVAPEPYRGKRNEPNFVVETVKRIAELKEENLETVKKTLAENALKMFGVSENAVKRQV